MHSSARCLLTGSQTCLDTSWFSHSASILLNTLNDLTAPAQSRTTPTHHIDMAASDVDAAASEPIEEVAKTEELKETVTASSATAVNKDHPEGDAIRKQVSTSPVLLLTITLTLARLNSTSLMRTSLPMRIFYSIAADARTCQSPSIASPDSRR
jgi:hypothetical protein